MIILRFILRHMFELLNFRHLLSSHLFVASTAVWKIGVPSISFYSYRRSLIRFHSAISEASKIPLLDHFWLPFQMLSQIALYAGEISADILKKSFVHFKQLRSLLLEDAVFMTDFSLWEVLGTLPSLEDLTLEANDPASHLAHAPEYSNSRSGGLRYFEALESLRVTGSFFFIQHLLNFIDSPCLKSIDVSTVIDRVHNEHDDAEDLLTPFMTIVASKWSQSLTNLVISSDTVENGITH